MNQPTLFKDARTPAPRKYRCRQKGCLNAYTDVIGGDSAFGKNYGGADCIPCNIAAQLIENGQTPELIEQHAQLMEMFLPFLKNTGWCWDDVKASFLRGPVVI
jgi:hypothetical protein